MMYLFVAIDVWTSKHPVHENFTLWNTISLRKPDMLLKLANKEKLYIVHNINTLR